MQFTQEKAADRGSPLWLTQRLEQRLAAVHAFATKRLENSFLQVSFAIFLSVAAYTLRMNTEYININFFGLFHASFGEALVMVCELLLISAICFKIWSRACWHTGSLWALSAIMAVIPPALEENTLVQAGVAVFGLVFRALIVWLTLTYSRNWPWRRRLGLYLVLLVCVMAIRVLIAAFESTLELKIFSVFWPTLFVLPFLVADQFSSVKRPDLSSLALKLQASPMMLIYAVPVPLQMFPDLNSNNSKTLKGQGLLSIAGGILLFIFAGLVYSRVCVIGEINTPLMFIWRGWTTYIFFYFGWLGFLHLGVGAGRWMGFPLQSPAYFALLSADLLSRWKRWNFFYYWFNFTFVWLPIVRATGLLLLATLAVYGVDFIGHNVYAFMPIFSTDQIIRSKGLFGLSMQGGFFLGHALSVYLGFISRNYWPSEQKFSGWVGVFLTHLTMALVHGCLRLD